MDVVDIVDLHERACRGFAAIASAVTSEQWSLATPCSEWDVRELLNHVVGEDLWTVPLFAGSTIAEVGDRFVGDLLGDDPGTACQEATEQAIRAVSAPGALIRTVHLSFGDLIGEEYAWQLFADHLIHGWDLAVAVGADPRLEPELVSRCAEWFGRHEDTYRAAGVVGPRAESSEGSEPQTMLLAAFGRAETAPPRHHVRQSASTRGSGV